MTRVLCPVSFDPNTKGHMNIIEQTCDLFDEVIIAVMQSPIKNNLFSPKERVDIIREIYQDNKKVKVISAAGATVDVTLANDCKIIIRGFRNQNDYNFEEQLRQINKEISNNKVNTTCFSPIRNKNSFLRTSLKKFLILIKISQHMSTQSF